MLGLVLAVITGTFKEAGSSSTSRVHPQPDVSESSGTKVIDTSQQVKLYLAQMEPNATGLDAAALVEGKKSKLESSNHVDENEKTSESISRCKSSEDPENGEVIMRQWAQVFILFPVPCQRSVDENHSLLQSMLSNPRLVHGISATIAAHAIAMNFDDPAGSANASQIITAVYILAHVV